MTTFRLGKALSVILFTSLFSASAQDLTGFADSVRIKCSIPEIAFAVVRANTVLTISVLGHHRYDSNEPASINDRFHIGSNTKAMTAFVAAKLVEEGKIKWETKFFSLFPDWKKEANNAYKDITLEKLLSHRAQIKPFTEGADLKKFTRPEGSKQDLRNAFARFVLQQEPAHSKDKTGFLYSNAGYTLAAVMLEKVTGLAWEELMMKTFTSDLKIDFGFSWPNLADRNQPWGHWKENDTLIALSPEVKYNMDLLEPAGDINMSLPEYIRFIQLNIEGLAGKNNYLKASAYRTLHIDKKDHLYAMGWGNKKSGDQLCSYHSGSAGTFYTRAVIDHSKQIAYIVMMNTATPEAEKGLEALIAKMQDVYGK